MDGVAQGTTSISGLLAVCLLGCAPAPTAADELGPDEPTPQSDSELPSATAAPLRRLTRAQYRATVLHTLDLPPDLAFVELLPLDDRAGGYAANTTAVTDTTLEQYERTAELIAASTTTAVSADSLDTVARRLFRRPLSPAERVELTQLLDHGGAQLALRAMLTAPDFLYRVENGRWLSPQLDRIRLDDDAIASRLAILLWGSTPDDALSESAARGELGDAEIRLDHMHRMLDDPRARESVGSFHVQWLGLDHLEDAFKDPGVYPEFSIDLADAMVDETRRFASLTVLQGDGRLDTLLTASHSYLTDPLFELYGVDVPEGFVTGMPVELDPQERAGIITQAAFLTEHALTNQSGPIQRGVEIRNQFFCDPPPPPPPDANVEPPAPDPGATTREIFEQHTADPTCASCHVLIDGIGLGMENYDGVGRYRTTENGKPVDATGELLATDVDGPFDGGVELAHQLAQSEQVRECVARQWFRFAFGRLEGDGDACSLDTLHLAFADSDYDVRALLIELVRTDAFLYRRK